MNKPKELSREKLCDWISKLKTLLESEKEENLHRSIFTDLEKITFEIDNKELSRQIMEWGNSLQFLMNKYFPGRFPPIIIKKELFPHIKPFPRFPFLVSRAPVDWDTIRQETKSYFNRLEEIVGTTLVLRG